MQAEFKQDEPARGWLPRCVQVCRLALRSRPRWADRHRVTRAGVFIAAAAMAGVVFSPGTEPADARALTPAHQADRAPTRAHVSSFEYELKLAPAPPRRPRCNSASASSTRSPGPPLPRPSHALRPPPP